MRDFELLYPETIAQACEALRAHDGEARALAGGTSMIQFLKERMFAPKVLVALQRIPGINAAAMDNGVLRIGAMARLTDLQHDPTVRGAAPMLAEALGVVGNVRIRNVATLGGNLCQADPHADPPTALVALDASVVLTDGRQSRRVPVAEFLLDYYETALQPGEMLSEIVVPAQPSTQVSSYRRFTAVSEEDWPCVTMAATASIEGGACSGLRIVVGALETRPRRIEGLDDLAPFEGGDAACRRAVADTLMQQLDPLDDLLGSAWYKREVSGALANDILADLFRQASNA